MRSPIPTAVRRPLPVLPALTLILSLSGRSAAADQWADHPLGLPAPPAQAIGFPSRTPDLDALPGFITPPPGYGEVAFYWWIGDPLTRERLTWQLDQLAGKGIMGLQINYPHSDVGGNAWGLTMPSEPPLFSPPWWELVQWFAAEAGKRGMAISLSDYTLGNPGQSQWVDEILGKHPDLHASVLAPTRWDAEGGKAFAATMPDGLVAVGAWQEQDGTALPGSYVDLRAKVDGQALHWQPATGRWKVMAVAAKVNERSIDPIDPRTGPAVVATFFQRFEDHLPGQGGKQLNWFFSDELSFGVLLHGRDMLWHRRFADEFRTRKGYDVVPELPALFADTGPRTPKIRLDFTDVMTALTEESFFKPLLLWHQQRGMIYGGDHGGRGGNVTEFGDYFRTQRWMSGPGNDQPGLGRSVCRTKVHSSIAHLYQQPRTWLEGYYGSGWGTTPAGLVSAGVENYCLGSNLQTFHGLYYTTHGGWWEWAPPCNHFRMPYWRHMGALMTWQQRLCYLLSQGVHRCDVAVLYPTSVVQAGGDNKQAVAAAFAIATALYDQGIDCDFIDDQSVARATIADGAMRVSGEAYQVLVLPAMTTAWQATIDQAERLAKAGGLVVATGTLPGASDRAGRDDTALAAQVKTLFGTGGTAAQDGRRARFVPDGKPSAAEQVVAVVKTGVPQQDVVTPRPGIHVNHHQVGSRDVFLVVGAKKGEDIVFRASGQVEQWDAWTGRRTPILAAVPVAGGTRVRLPVDAANGLLVVFAPGQAAMSLVRSDLDEVTEVVERGGSVVVQGFAATPGPKTAQIRRGDATVMLAGTAPVQPEGLALDDDWAFTLEPTCDNRFGDYRLPASDGFIGAEARRFHYQDETAADAAWQMPGSDAARWPQTTHGYGPRFWKLGPIPAGAEADALEAKLAAAGTIDAAAAVRIAGKDLRWQPYHFSWREGIEGDPGHQGYHGLKGNVSDDFIGLGKRANVKHKDYRSGDPSYVAESPAGGKYLLWTTVFSPKAGPARVLSGDMKPASLWLGGAQQAGDVALVTLRQGANPLLAVYAQAGRTHLVVQSADAAAEPAGRTPLAMRWYDLPGVLPFVTQPTQAGAVGRYRFTAPPALTSMTLAAHGAVQAWVDGMPCTVERTGTHRDGATRYRVTVAEVKAGTAEVALRIAQEPGCQAGAAIPEPVGLVCGTGRLPVGDWSQIDGLASYSGAAWYRRTVVLAPEQLRGRVTLRLGSVAASAEVRINGTVAGTVLAPPWEVEVTGLVKAGDNRVEIQVCNTLANHYLTIPTRYRGSPVSGLLGPVRLVTELPVTLTAAGP